SIQSLDDDAPKLRANAESANVDPRATRAILLTSGTTGAPKGAELTVGNFFGSAEASAENLGGESTQRWLACLPLFHVGGLAMVIRCACYGACLILHERFDEELVNQSLDEQGITHTSLVQTMLARVLETRGKRPFSPSFKACLLGGGPTSGEVR